MGGRSAGRPATASRRAAPPPASCTSPSPLTPHPSHLLSTLHVSGELQEPSKKAILRVTAAQDALMEGSGDSKVSDSKYEI